MTATGAIEAVWRIEQPKLAARLTQVAKNRALDRLRRTTLIDSKHRELAIDLTELEREPPNIEAALDEDIDDDLLRLFFTVCLRFSAVLKSIEQEFALAGPKIARGHTAAVRRSIRLFRGQRGCAW